MSRWRIVLVLPVMLIASAAWCQTPPRPSLTADEIMARVAANQDRSEHLRTRYVYEQRLKISTRRSNGKLVREEASEYHVVPGTDGTKKHLKVVSGRYWHKDRYLDFKGEPIPDSGSIDGSIISDFRDELLNEKSRDGIGHGLFPLTSEVQKKYRFKLLGKQEYQGRKIYRIGFRPKDRGNLAWAGEAYIDREELQPVMVFTKLSRKVPFWVRTFMGTDVPGLGFSVQYKPQGEGIWFPTSMGTEFRIRAVFFFKRDLFLSMENFDFEQTHVDSKIEVITPPE